MILTLNQDAKARGVKEAQKAVVYLAHIDISAPFGDQNGSKAEEHHGHG
jgi:hypothetical protein